MSIEWIVALVFLPVFIWMSIGIYKEGQREYGEKVWHDVLGKSVWLLICLFASASFFSRVFFDAFLSVALLPN